METTEPNQETLDQGQETPDTIDLRGANVKVIDGEQIDQRLEKRLQRPALSLDEAIVNRSAGLLVQTLQQLDIEMNQPIDTRLVKVQTPEGDEAEQEVPHVDHLRVAALASAARDLTEVIESAHKRVKEVTRHTPKGKKNGKR